MAAKKRAVEVTVTTAEPSREEVERLRAVLSAGGTPPRDELAERVTRLEQQLTALLVTTQPLVIRGHVVPKCACRKLSTRTIVWTHPSTGQRQFDVCDSCQPEHPLLGYAGSKVVETTRFTPEELTRVRSLNEALKCVPSL